MKPLVLITGASSGIGLELAKCFAATHDLILVARRGAELQKLSAELSNEFKIQVHVLPADLSEPEAPAKVFAATQAKGWVVETLVNNAGFGGLGAFAEADQAKMMKMIQLNAMALTELTGLYLPGMKQRGKGRVLNVASTAAFIPGPLMAVYYATKAYVHSFSEALWEELRGTGVTVTSLCPGPTKTEFGDTAGLSGTKLFSGPNLLTSTAVARAGYTAAMKGQRMVMPGFLNKLLIFGARLMPRGLLLKMVKGFQSKRV